MGVVLLISHSIGVYFGLIKRQRTPEEYLLGNRQIQLLPVALSMIVTYQSATSVIGVPTEIYLYPTMYLYTFVGYVVCVVVQLLTIVPLMYPLRLSSAYEVGQFTISCYVHLKPVKRKVGVLFILRFQYNFNECKSLYVLKGDREPGHFIHRLIYNFLYFC